MMRVRRFANTISSFDFETGEIIVKWKFVDITPTSRFQNNKLIGLFPPLL